MKEVLKTRPEKSFDMKKCKKAVLAFFLMLICLSALSVSSFAAPLYGESSSKPAEVILPVSVVEAGEKPSKPEKYMIRLESKDNAPLPDSAEGYFDIAVTGENTANFPPVSYKKVGIYRYSIYQIEGNYPGTYYDDGIYNVTVTVMNTEKGNDMKAVISIAKDGRKYETAKFVNEYTKNPGSDDKPPVSHKGDPIVIGDRTHEVNPNTGAPAVNVAFAAAVSLAAAVILSKKK